MPETPDFGAPGQCVFALSNLGDESYQGAVTVNLYVSSDKTLDRAEPGTRDYDALLTSIQLEDVQIGAGQSDRFSLNFESITSGIAQGSFNYIVEVVPTGNPEVASAIKSKAVRAIGSDAILEWNAIALNAIEASGKAGIGIPPTEGSRMLAIMSTAVFDAVNAFSNQYESYAVDRDVPLGASLNAAIAGASFRVLRQLLPNQRSLLMKEKNAFLRRLKESTDAEGLGFEFGRDIANESLILRRNDGSRSTSTIPVAEPGEYLWQPDSGTKPLSSQWGKVKPFGVPNIAEFSPDGLDGRPDAADPSQYIREIEEVRVLGGLENTATTTLTRTEDQTNQALFWAYDRDDSFKPYGHLNQITQEIALREGNTIEENARLFALLNVSLADAAITAWGAKYREMQPRPDDVISGDGGVPFALVDGFEETVADPDWEPLLGSLTPQGGSPPFPDYTSGHATFGGAFAGALTEIYGENYEFTTVSQDLMGQTRTFSSFAEAGLEDALSRVYGGVHVREAGIDGFNSGFNIGTYVAQNLFQPINPLTNPEPLG